LQAIQSDMIHFGELSANVPRNRTAIRLLLSKKVDFKRIEKSQEICYLYEETNLTKV